MDACAAEAAPIQPFLKWAGGKRQLLPQIRPLMPAAFRRYYEPFLGGGAVLFDLQPAQAVVNDFNSELINCYQVVRDELPALIAELEQYRNEKDFFYRLRALDRQDAFQELSPVKRAARIIYLNKTCFNGLFRVNSKGYFNVPFGSYRNPRLLDMPLLRSVSAYLNRGSVTFLNGDYEEALATCEAGDFVYLDPPYDPLSATASFTSYSTAPFGKEAQCRLRDVFSRLTEAGSKVMLSNSATDFIKALYADFKVMTVSCGRNINSVGSKRSRIEELLILNYEP